MAPENAGDGPHLNVTAKNGKRNGEKDGTEKAIKRVVRKGVKDRIKEGEKNVLRKYQKENPLVLKRSFCREQGTPVLRLQTWTTP